MIRFMEERDIPEVLAIYNDIILTSKAVYRYDIQTLDEKVQWFREQQALDNPLLVFEDNGLVAGFATIVNSVLTQAINIQWSTLSMCIKNIIKKGLRQSS